MRSFALTACLLAAVACLATGYQEVPSSYSEFSPTTPSPSRSGPLSKWFNWFRGPSDKQPQEQPDPLANVDFSNPLPKDNTDSMINNAITDRILEESRPQQVFVGSPFIGEEQSLDREASASEPQSAVAPPRESYGKSMANTATDNLPLAEALRIVHSSQLDDCVARVICELSCNANAYGTQGRAVFRNLIKLQFDQNVKSDDAKFFRQAASRGRQIVQGKRDCQECFTIYPKCNSSSKDLVAVSSMFKL